MSRTDRQAGLSSPGGTSHLPFIRCREKSSLSSADRVELKGTHVGLMALLLTLSFLGEEQTSVTDPDSRRGGRGSEHLRLSPGVVTLNGNHSWIGSQDHWVAGRGGVIVQACAVNQGVWGHLGRSRHGRVNTSTQSICKVIQMSPRTSLSQMENLTSSFPTSAQSTGNCLGKDWTLEAGDFRAQSARAAIGRRAPQ